MRLYYAVCCGVFPLCRDMVCGVEFRMVVVKCVVEKCLGVVMVGVLVLLFG